VYQLCALGQIAHTKAPRKNNLSNYFFGRIM
jgi:hypothetical protein